jgi:carboxymethylenebutenolidase
VGSVEGVSANSTAAYADAPKSGSGPGVLVLHSWWGLTDSVRDRCNQLADAGFCALAPDLFGGVTAEDPEHGRALLGDVDANQLALSIKSCADALRRMPATPTGPIMVVGFSMGASLGLWLSEREPDGVSAVVGHYGTQGIDFTATRSRYQLHMTLDDPLIDPDELALMEASLRLADRPVEIHTYEGAAHNFAEPEAPGFDPVAARLAWERTIEFLAAER